MGHHDKIILIYSDNIRARKLYPVLWRLDWIKGIHIWSLHIQDVVCMWLWILALHRNKQVHSRIVCVYIHTFPFIHTYQCDSILWQPCFISILPEQSKMKKKQHCCVWIPCKFLCIRATTYLYLVAIGQPWYGGLC